MSATHPLTLEQLLHRVRTQPQWVLPEFVGAPNSEGLATVRWMWRIIQGFIAVLALSLFVQLAQQYPWLAATVGVFGVGFSIWWWRYRTPRERPLGDPLALLYADAKDWRGCVVEVAPRIVRSFGLREEMQWHLEPANEWSLGILEYGNTNQHGYKAPVLSCVIELRHMRRGPVMVLCTLHLSRDSAKVRQQVEQLVSAMAQRLGIRRSGQGLLP